MSHFQRVRTEIREPAILRQALNDLRLAFREGDELPVRGWQGRSEMAEIVVETGTDFDVGLKLGPAGYEIVADWWGIEGQSHIRQKTFLESLRRRYAYCVVLEQAREQDLIVEEERTLENGDVVIVLSERG